MKTDQNHPDWLHLGEIPMILRKSDEAMASSASVVATAMTIDYTVQPVLILGRDNWSQ